MKSIKQNIALAFMTAAILTGCSSTEESSDKKVIHYDFDKSNIKKEFKAMLDKEAEYLKNNPKTNVTIEGHCDSRGTPEYNMALGDRRAKSVKNYLAKKGLTNQMSLKSFGEEKPEAKGAATEEDHKKNRRAVLVYSS